MQPEPVTIETADKWDVLLRFLFPSVVGIIVMMLVYVLFRWKITADRRELEELKPERMKLRMEALAAKKKAARKSDEPDAGNPETAETETRETANGDNLDIPTAIG